MPTTMATARTKAAPRNAAPPVDDRARPGTSIRGLSPEEIEELDAWAGAEEEDLRREGRIGRVSRNDLLLKVIRDALAAWRNDKGRKLREWSQTPGAVAKP